MLHLHTRGFHLIEASLAVALAALIAAISLPSVRQLSRTQVLKSETRRFAALLEMLGVEALQRETEIQVTVEAQGYTVARPGRQDAGLFAPEVRADVRATASRLKFYPSGATTPATVILHAGDRTCSITLSLRGRVASQCP